MRRIHDFLRNRVTGARLDCKLTEQRTALFMLTLQAARFTSKQLRMRVRTTKRKDVKRLYVKI